MGTENAPGRRRAATGTDPSTQVVDNQQKRMLISFIFSVPSVSAGITDPGYSAHVVWMWGQRMRPAGGGERSFEVRR
jgi:hypothetical protein